MASVEPITLPAPVIDPVAPPGKWARGYQAFQRLLPDLLRAQRDRYVAVHDGQVVASGNEKLAVALAAFQQVGNVPIHVGLVTEEAQPVVRSGVRRVLPMAGDVP